MKSPNPSLSIKKDRISEWSVGEFLFRKTAGIFSAFFRFASSELKFSKGMSGISFLIMERRSNPARASIFPFRGKRTSENTLSR